MLKGSCGAELIRSPFEEQSFNIDSPELECPKPLLNPVNHEH